MNTVQNFHAKNNPFIELSDVGCFLWGFVSTRLMNGTVAGVNLLFSVNFGEIGVNLYVYG